MLTGTVGWSCLEKGKVSCQLLIHKSGHLVIEVINDLRREVSVGWIEERMEAEEIVLHKP